MTKQEITNIINQCWEAVNESVVGPVLVRHEGENQVHSIIAVNTYYKILDSLLPKNIKSEMGTPKEPWQE